MDGRARASEASGLLVLLALAAVACASTTGGGSSSATGAGAAASTSSSAAGTGGGPCSGVVVLTIDDDAPIELTSNCAADPWTPPSVLESAVGTIYLGGPPDLNDLYVYGCSSVAPNSPGFELDLRSSSREFPLGAYPYVFFTYTTAQGASWTNPCATTAELTELGPQLGRIRGSVSRTIVPGNHTVSATFDVCHGNDIGP
jgi:hypothetical protein